MKFFSKGAALVLMLVAGFSGKSTLAAEVKVFNPTTKKWITPEQVFKQLETTQWLVLGEKHNTSKVQLLEAELFKKFQAIKNQKITFAWEFLNWSDRETVQVSYDRFLNNQLSSVELIHELLGANAANETYAPIFDVLKETQSVLLTTNLSREEKAPVVKGGLEALDPALLPEGFELGSTSYFERFVNAMGGHGNEDSFKNYFAAQCLVDDVIAYHVTQNAQTEQGVLVIGDFHIGYKDGVVKRLEKRMSTTADGSLTVIDILDRDDYDSEDELMKAINHSQYGELADFVFILSQGELTD